MAHSVSMLLLALLDARRRRVALVDAVVACGFALGGLAALAANHGVHREVIETGCGSVGHLTPPDRLQCHEKDT